MDQEPALALALALDRGLALAREQAQLLAELGLDKDGIVRAVRARAESQ
jgi:hypothetical protein